ncbi:MAG: TRAP transporter small permease [Pseudomonadota bacterium]
MVERLARLWALAGGFVLLAIMLVTTVNIAAFSADQLAGLWGGNVYGLTGYEDFVTLAIASCGLMFFPWCQAKRGHVVVDVFTTFLPAALRQALDRLWLIVICALALFLAYWMVQGLIQVWSDNALTAILGWPVWPSFVPGIISLLLWALVAGSQVFEAPTEGDAARV